jgi:hypothetical protein
MQEAAQDHLALYGRVTAEARRRAAADVTAAPKAAVAG